MILQVVFAAISAVCFAIIFNSRGLNILLAAINGGVGYAIFLLVFPHNSVAAFFASSVFLSAYSEMTARIRKTPAAVFLVAGLIPIVPGKGMFNCMLSLVEGNTAQAMTQAVSTLIEAGAIAVGIIIVTSVVKLIPPRNHGKTLNR